MGSRPAVGPDLPPVQACPTDERRVLQHQLETGLDVRTHVQHGPPVRRGIGAGRCPPTVAYEAQAAIELEGLSRNTDGGATAYAFDIDTAQLPAVIDAAPVLAAIIRDLRAGVRAGVIGARFHRAVAELVVDLAVTAGHGNLKPSRCPAVCSRTLCCCGSH